ncbi:MAG: oxidoreductase-like domain-containing protein [Pseudomonadota bacterium]|nr:oxidoreductase-like domain-containing protein [Pseudomonadota bacterium]
MLPVPRQPSGSGHEANADATDPRPSPPERPLPSDCCESGCDRCVFTVYAEEVEAYEQALGDWSLRRAGRSSPPR